MHDDYTDPGWTSLAYAIDDLPPWPDLDPRRFSIDLDGARRIGRTARPVDVERLVDVVRTAAEQRADSTGRYVEWSVNHSPAWDDHTTPPPGWSSWSGTADPHRMTHPFEVVR